jgi:hypothetical protein
MEIREIGDRNPKYRRLALAVRAISCNTMTLYEIAY